MTNLYRVVGGVDNVGAATGQFFHSDTGNGWVTFFLDVTNNDGDRSNEWSVAAADVEQIVPFVANAAVYPQVGNKRVATGKPPVGSYVIGARRAEGDGVHDRTWHSWVLGRVVSHFHNARLPLQVVRVNRHGNEFGPLVNLRCWYPLPDGYVTADKPTFDEGDVLDDEPEDLTAFKNRVWEVATRYGQENGHTGQIAQALRELGITGPAGPDAYEFDVVLRYRVSAKRTNTDPIGDVTDYIYGTLGVRQRDHNLRMDERWVDPQIRYVEHGIENIQPI